MNWAVVMAGGPGTRFWPESRSSRPKPFLKLLGKRTLIEETVQRLKPLFPPRRILLVIQETLVKEAKRLLPEIPRKNILGEPVGRNTAPCCVWAAAEIERRDPKAKIVFLPADQHIPEKSLYRRTLKTALRLADDRPVLLGLRPDSPSPAYGYLEVARKRKAEKGLAVFDVIRFCEKPSVAKARQFLKKGNFFWNGGTFVWRLDAFKRAVKKFVPRIYEAWKPLQSLRGVPPRWAGRRSSLTEGHPERSEGSRDPSAALRPQDDAVRQIASATFGALPRNDLKRIYRRLPSISLDYAVMEKMRNVHCLEAPFQLDDLGGWLGLAQFWAKDRAGNRVGASSLRASAASEKRGQAPRVPVPFFVHSRRNIVKPDRRLIALLGIENLLIVDTPDALLICPKSKTEEIRQIVRELERRKATEYL